MDFNKLKKAELVALLEAYSDYVMGFTMREGWPVCVREFYDSEWEDYYKSKYMKGE